MNNNIIPQETVDSMIRDKKVRVAITKESHLYFFHFYFPHYIKYPTADFQREIIQLTEDENIRNFCVVAFRGSAKSTIVTTSYPVWAILGRQKKKFVLILCQTQAQAKQHMMNLRRELETNVVLKGDLGPFKESDEWGSTSIVFSELNARITVASSEQSIRGIRHNEHRPDLIICDDVEDIASTKTREGRNKTYQWLTGEVIPTGDRNTRLVVIGNLLHEDSLLMRLEADIESGRINGTFKRYPLIDPNGRILWAGKYPTLADVEEDKKKMGNEYAWQREYLLHIVPTEDQAIHREWIQYYDEVPLNLKDEDGYSITMGVHIGVDLAISQRDTADYTAMVPARIIGNGDEAMIYILPDIVNRRMTFPETIELCKVLNVSHADKGGYEPTFIIEDVAYQKALPQQLEREGIYNVKTTRPGNQDKRSRLVLTAHLIKSGKVLFPKEGAEQLISQIVNFGVEKHDDLADAFSSLVLSIVENPPIIPKITWISF
jgi:predicted phage terminase large subunit-like protein